MSEVTTIEVTDIGEATRAAARAPTPLVWLLDRDVRADERTLPALLEHADAPAVSLPVFADGRIAVPALGTFYDADVEAVLAAAQRRRAPLLHTRVTSLLLERDLAAAIAPADTAGYGALAGSEWTARLFELRRGQLVPASRVTVAAPPQRALAPALRLARSGRWRTGEAVREALAAARVRVRER